MTLIVLFLIARLYYFIALSLWLRNLPGFFAATCFFFGTLCNHYCYKFVCFSLSLASIPFSNENNRIGWKIVFENFHFVPLISSSSSSTPYLFEKKWPHWNTFNAFYDLENIVVCVCVRVLYTKCYCFRFAAFDSNSDGWWQLIFFRLLTFKLCLRIACNNHYYMRVVLCVRIHI